MIKITSAKPLRCMSPIKGMSTNRVILESTGLIFDVLTIFKTIKKDQRDKNQTYQQTSWDLGEEGMILQGFNTQRKIETKMEKARENCLVTMIRKHLVMTHLHSL